MIPRQHKFHPMLLVSIAFFSFLLNLFWEVIHESFLYKTHMMPSFSHPVVILYATLVDTFYIVLVYALVALFLRNGIWVKKMPMNATLLFCVGVFIVSLLIEVRGVYIVHSWSYDSMMPTLFGIGISPMLQLVTTGILSLWLTKKLMRSVI